MKTAMVWGAGGGIGTAVTQQLISAGWQVAALGRGVEQWEGVATCAIEVQDTADDAAVRRAIREATYELDRVDLWFYGVGEIVASPTATLTVAQWNQMLAANLTGAFLTTQHSLPLLADKGHLMYVGAIHERLRLPGLGAYAAVKAGLEAFTEALRKEERGKKVTVFRPGAVATPFWDKVPLRLPKDAMSAELLASKVLAAYEGEQQGVVDFTH